MNNSSSNTRTTLNGKEIGEEDSSSISTMSSVDIGSRQEMLEVSDYDVKIEGKLMTDSRIVNAEETSKDSETNSSPHIIEEDEENQDTKLSNSSSNPSDSDVWSLFDDSDEYPELVDEMAATDDEIPHEPNLVDSHDTSHFIEASTHKLADQGNSFMMPRPDSFGNFSPTKTPESSQCKLSEEEITDLKSSATILSSKNGDSSTPSKGEELLSLGADILMEKSLLTGKLTLEDPSQSTENEDFSTRPPSPVSTKNNPFRPSLKLLVTSFLMVSGSTSGVFYFAKKSSYWEQSALELQDEIELLRKDLEARENQLKDFEEREKIHLEQIANATVFCGKEVKEVPSFSWEEKSTPNIFSIDNCWLSAQASFELGLCPQRYLKQVLNTLGFGDSFDNFMNEDYGENDKEEDEYDGENDVNEYDVNGMMKSVFSSYLPRDFVNEPKTSDCPDNPTVDLEEDSPITSKEKENFMSYSTYPFIQEASVAHASWNFIENIGGIAKEFVDAVLLPNDPKKILDGSIWEDVVHKDTKEKN